MGSGHGRPGTDRGRLGTGWVGRRTGRRRTDRRRGTGLGLRRVGIGRGHGHGHGRGQRRYHLERMVDVNIGFVFC